MNCGSWHDHSISWRSFLNKSSPGFVVSEKSLRTSTIPIRRVSGESYVSGALEILVYTSTGRNCLAKYTRVSGNMTVSPVLLTASIRYSVLLSSLRLPLTWSNAVGA